MGTIDGFLQHNRQAAAKRTPEERRADNQEFVSSFSEEQAHQQSGRCMDCGVPFCHEGCPLGNLIPDFNEAVHEGHWERAYRLLTETNNFPEFTGRICPAPCESSCVLSINRDAVTIEEIEKTIIEHAFKKGWVQPRLPKRRTGKRVAVVGSGPAGLAAAAQLNQVGHAVTVLEKDDAIGGLLRYGIPDFKLEKSVIDRRLAILEAEGVVFRTQVTVGDSLPVAQLQAEYDAVLLAMGALVPRPLTIPGHDAQGVYPAMDYLTQHNRWVAEGEPTKKPSLWAEGQHVVVIGGGDTGSDCVGTANRQAAASVTQLQYRPAPGQQRPAENLWPEEPMVFTATTSHEEGCDRQWSMLTKGFTLDAEGTIKGLRIVELEWTDLKNRQYREKPGTEQVLPCDLALVAIGYQHPEPKGLLSELGVQLTQRGMVEVDDQFQTSEPGVFAAGDAQRGQSLVVWALADGRKAAKSIDRYLMGQSQLASNEESTLAVR